LRLSGQSVLLPTAMILLGTGMSDLGISTLML
jgi:hypothetical protein